MRSGDRVAVLSYGSEQVLAWMAECERVGAVLVPLSWRLAEEELVEIVEDCRPSVILADREHQEIARRLRRQHDVGLGLESDVAQLLYTSGTTGKPRAVA